ncbi:MAG: type II secretion system F family protein [Planctomycetota bacterium]
MKQFVYKTKSKAGKVVEGEIGAETEMEAVNELQRRGLTVISVSQGRSGGAGKATRAKASSGGGDRPKQAVSFGQPKVRGQDLVLMTRQLATMVSAGIPLVEGLEILEGQVANKTLQKALSQVVVDVRSGKDLSQALASHPKIFADIFINMIKAGEASGQLDVVLDRLANYQEASENLRNEIKSAMTYPVVSLIMIFGITTFLLVFIIPRFEEMFISMNVELPMITQMLLDTSLFMKSNFLLMGLAFVVAIIGIAFWFKTPKGLYVRDWLLLKAPIMGPLFSKVALSRFSKTFSTLIRSGVPILGALEIVQSTAGNRLFSDAIGAASERVRQGETLGDPLAASKVFPPMVTRMVAIGERSGSLEQLLEKISEFYDAQVSTTVKSLTSLIEPLMIAIMGFVVGGMVVSIFLPIFKMIGSLNK